MVSASFEAVRSQAISSRPQAADNRSLKALPRPVVRYLQHALAPDRRGIRLARYRQSGMLKTDLTSARWLHFSATQIMAATTCAFVWEARVSVLPLLHLQVRDSLLDGIGAAEVALLSAVPIARARGNLSMNAGALHRFLAEAVWCPAALLPSAALRWEPVDDTRALATLTGRNATVSLEFRFGPRNEVVGIYTPGRWASFGGGWRQLAWEGRFHDYVERDGVLIPTRGEVGWYLDGEWRSVWQGRVTHAAFE